MIRSIARFGCRASCLALFLVLDIAHARRAFYNTSFERDANILNVHVVHHSHNDPGWLHSYAQYHRTLVLDGHTIGGVEGILDSVTSALLDNPDRTFAYADIAFFAKWWQELHADTKESVRQLVQQRRLEFVSGGIVQHDEATSHYSAMVDQVSMGMRFLQQEFGVTPRVAWQLDGFGHSNTEALLRSMGGFDALFFGRSDESDLQQRKQTGNLELVWRGSESLGSETDIFVVQYPTGNYGPPSMKWWFERREDYGKDMPDWIRDDPETLDGYNVQATVDLFVKKAQKWQSFVQGNDIIFFMGGDFSHSNAWQWFNSIDKMIHYVNKDGRVNAFYSTPSKYVKSKLHNSSIRWALKTDDFFPYCGDRKGTDYWTGFYTTRPSLKGQIRRASALLQATRQVEVAAGLGPSSSALATSRGFQDDPDVVGEQLHSEVVSHANELAPDQDTAVLEFGLAVLQHHDGITGTQKYTVAHDYQHWLHVGMIKAAPKFLQGLHKLMYPASDTTPYADTNTSQSSTSTAQQSKHHSSVKTSFRVSSTQHSTSTSVSSMATAAAALVHADSVIASRLGWLFRRRLTHAAGALAATDYKEEDDDDAGADADEDLQDAAASQLIAGKELSTGTLNASQYAMPRTAHDRLAHSHNIRVSNATSQVQRRIDRRAEAALTSITSAAPQLRTCLLLNASYCASSMQLSKQGGFLLVVYNPLAWEYNQGVKIPVNEGSYVVHDPHGNPVSSQLLPVSESQRMLWNFTVPPAANTAGKPAAAAVRVRQGLGDWELAVQVRAAPLGHAVYTVKPVTAALQGHRQAAVGERTRQTRVVGPTSAHVAATSTVVKMPKQSPDIRLSTGNLEVTVSTAVGGFKTLRVAGQEYGFNVGLLVYSGLSGGSGAYVFKANKPPDVLQPPIVTIIHGPVLQEVQLYYKRLGILVIRLWKGASHLEVEWTVGLLPIEMDCEVFVRYDTSIRSGGVWYTDANGREYQQRKRSYRPAFKLPWSSEFAPGNLYPVTTGAYITDKHTQNPSQYPSSSNAGTGRNKSSSQSHHLAAHMHVAVDRPQGVASLYDGGLDFNVHRVSAEDDGKGMGENLLDRTVARGTHIVSFGSSSHAAVAAGATAADSVTADTSLYTTSRHHEQRLVDPLQLAFGPLPAPEAPPIAQSSLVQQPILSKLPASIHIMTLKWLACDTLLLRLSHMFQVGEHPSLSNTAVVDIHSLLDVGVVRIVESTLFAEAAYRQQQHLEFQLGMNLTHRDPPRNLSAPEFRFTDNRIPGELPRGTGITLHPMQIRSFFVQIQHNKQLAACRSTGHQHGTAAPTKLVPISRSSHSSYSHSRLASNGHLRIFGARLDNMLKIPEYVLVTSPVFVILSLWLLMCWSRRLKHLTKNWKHRSKRKSMNQSCAGVATGA